MSGINVVSYCEVWWGLSRAYHTTLYLSRSYPMPLDIDDIINTPCDLVIPVRVPQCPITGEIETRVWAVIRVHELLTVTIYGTSHPRPWFPDAKLTTDIRARLLFTLTKDPDAMISEKSHEQQTPDAMADPG